MVRGLTLISDPCQASEMIIVDPKGTYGGPLMDLEPFFYLILKPQSQILD